MPLSRNVIAQKGKRLTAATHFGHGWREYDPQRQAKEMDTPGDFCFVVEDFLETEGAIVAAVGRVTQPGHPCDGLELCGLSVPYDEVDFEVANYHLLLTPQRARLTGRQPPPHYESADGSGYPEFRGYGFIRHESGSVPLH
jgi:hypothetical protein